MRIAVIGAGNVGGTLGRRWAELGHDVAFGVRHPEQGASEVKGGDALPAKARVSAIAEAVANTDVVLLATPWDAAPDALRHADGANGALNGVTLIDATNPLGPGYTYLAGPKGESGAEQLQALAPNARVVKCFNTTGFGNMANPRFGDASATMFYAGDDAGAKAHAQRLAADLGFETVDAGALIRSRQLEHLAILWISLSRGGHGREIAFRLVGR